MADGALYLYAVADSDLTEAEVAGVRAVDDSPVQVVTEAPVAAVSREVGDMSEEPQENPCGLGLMRLEDAMVDLREHFGLWPVDLNFDLGPLGHLLPHSDGNAQ